MTIKKDLLAMQKNLTAISKKVENLIKAVEKSEKATVTKASKVKVIKATPAKKASIAPVKKKAVTITATDEILKIINRSKKGVNTATLMEKTGFDQKKVTNIIQRTLKLGKIQRAERGIYVGVK